MTTQTYPVVNAANLYVNDLAVTYATTTTLTVQYGAARDSNNVMDLILLAADSDLSTAGYVVAPLTLNSAIVGANGVDATVVASKMYSIYLIGSTASGNPIACIASLSSNSAPTLPAGYDSYRLISYWATNSSSQWILGYNSGNGKVRTFTYDAPVATSVTAGAQTSYTGIVLTTLVPPVNQTPVLVQSNFTPATAADTLKFQGYNSTGDAVTIIGQVATVHVQTVNQVLAQLNTAAPTISYKVSAGGDAVAVNVAAFTYYL